MIEAKLNSRKEITFTTKISKNESASMAHFRVSIDESLFETRRQFFRAIGYHNIAAFTPTGNFKIYDSVVARVLVEKFIRGNCSHQTGLKAYSDGHVYKIN